MAKGLHGSTSAEQQLEIELRKPLAWPLRFRLNGSESLHPVKGSLISENPAQRPSVPH